MHNRKKSKHIFNIALIALAAVIVVSSSAMAGCGEDKEEAQKTSATKVVTETQIETEIVTVADEGSNDKKTNDDSKGSAENKNNNSSSSSNSGNSSNSSNNSNSSNKSGNSSSSSKTNNNNNSNNSVKDDSLYNNSDAEDNKYSDTEITENNNSNTNHDIEDKSLTVDGQKYYVGDLIKCKVSLKTPDIIENFQGIIEYDSKYLAVKKAVLCKPAKGGSLINSKNAGVIKFNGSEISEGYDFVGGNDFAEVVFEVVGTGKSTPKITWNVITQFSGSKVGTKYVVNDKPANGMSYSVEYSG